VLCPSFALRAMAIPHYRGGRVGAFGLGVLRATTTWNESHDRRRDRAARRRPARGAVHRLGLHCENRRPAPAGASRQTDPRLDSYKRSAQPAAGIRGFVHRPIPRRRLFTVPRATTRSSRKIRAWIAGGLGLLLRTGSVEQITA